MLDTTNGGAEYPLPAIRWARQDNGDVSIIHYVETDGTFRAHASIVEVQRLGRNWSLHVVDGEELDEASAILLAGDLSADADGRRCTYRVDPSDIARAA